MKTPQMTNLIRQKHTFLYHGQAFECYDLTLEDFLLITIDHDAGYRKVLLECNEELPTLNDRQQNEFLRILLGQDEEKPQVIDQLTETQKKIKAHKEKQKKVEDEKQSMLDDFHIIEGQMMHFLHQPLSELRSWPYRYFLQVYKDLAICTGAKEYDKNRNSTKPDKAGFKKEFWSVYNK